MHGIESISQLCDTYGSNIPLLAQACADAIPPLFSETGAIHARIKLNDLDFYSHEFKTAKIKVAHSFQVPKKCSGKIEIHISAESDTQQLEEYRQKAHEIARQIGEKIKAAILIIPTTDITLDSEKRYQLLAENSIDVIWIMDPLLNFTYISPSIERMTGFTQKEWIGTNLSAHATRKEFIRMSKQVILTMRGLLGTDFVIFTTKMLKKNGEEFPVEVIGRLLLNKKGFPIGVQGSTRDISERVEAEEALKKGREQNIHSIEQLYQAGQQLGQSLDLNKIYAALHEIITRSMPCDGIIVSSYKPKDALLVCEAMFHESTAVDVSGFPAIPLEPPGKGTQSQVVHSGQSLYLSDYLAHQKKSKSSYFVNADGIYEPEDVPIDEDITRSAVLVPLKREGQVIGVIQVTSYRLNAFTEDNLHFLETLAPQISAAISNAALFEEAQKAQQSLQLSLQGTIQTLARTVETRDPYTAGHQRRVADLAEAIARKMGLSEDEIDGIRMASIVHDIGKINIPAEILSKPGKLSELEFALIKTHPQVAADLLEGITFPWPIARAILQHHEKLDGSGYPQGLRGDQISREARILVVADIVEAMSSHRPYRPALGIGVALNQIKIERGKKLDAQVVDTCLDLFKEGYQFIEAEQP